MKILRENWLLTLCIGTICLFLTQNALCLAEHAGLVSCCDHSAQHEESSSSNEDSTPAHCCQVHSQGALVLETERIVGSTILTASFLSREDAYPDGPVLEIEHPPQLS